MILKCKRCIAPQEKEEAKAFRQKHFFDSRSLQDPYVWTFNRGGHAHFALYQDDRMIGYAHIQYWPGSRAALRIIVVDEKQRNKGYGSYLLNCCEQILKEEGIKILHTESSPDAVEFYKRFGYSEMPFDDPDKFSSDKRDIPLGKVL